MRNCPRGVRKRTERILARFWAMLKNRHSRYTFRVSEDSHLKKLADTAGFAFQLSVCKMLEQTRNVHGWKVLSTEHLWRDNNGEAQYADIVLAKETMIMVIECKRQVRKSWLFFDEERGAIKQFPLLWTQRESVGKKFVEAIRWDEFDVQPASGEFAFCVQEGANDKDRPMLERVAGHLLESTEKIALQELALLSGGEVRSIFVPVIATSARLCSRPIDHQSIDLETGEIRDQRPFSDEQVVRFRKSMFTQMPLGDWTTQFKSFSNRSGSLESQNVKAERAVFVVNSTFLVEFLTNFHVTTIRRNTWPPGETIRHLIDKLPPE
jgi:hypothetical protein